MSKVTYQQWQKFKRRVDTLRTEHGYSWTRISQLCGSKNRGWAKSAYDKSRSLVETRHVTMLNDEITRLEEAAGARSDEAAAKGRGRLCALIDEMVASPYELAPQQIARLFDLGLATLNSMAYGTNGESAPEATEVTRLELLWERARRDERFVQKRLGHGESILAEKRYAPKRLNARLLEAADQLRDLGLSWPEIAGLQDVYRNGNTLGTTVRSVRGGKQNATAKGVAALEAALERATAPGFRPGKERRVKPVASRKPGAQKLPRRERFPRHPDAAAGASSPAAKAERPATVESRLKEAVDHLVLASVALAEAAELAKGPGSPAFVRQGIAQGRDLLAKALEWLAGDS